MIIINCVQGSEEWHQARAGVITASMFSVATEMLSTLTDQQRTYVEALLAGADKEDAKAAAGYKAAPTAGAITDALAGKPTRIVSAASIAYADEIAIERLSGEPYGDTFQTFAMKRGSEQEIWARARYEELYGVEVTESGICLTDDRLFGYSTDGLVDKSGLIEIKTPLSLAKIRSVVENDDTSEYEHQVQGGLWLTGRLYCDLIMYVPSLEKIGNDVYVKRIHRDDDFIEKLELDLMAFAARVTEAEKFWRKQFRRDGLDAVAQAAKLASVPTPARAASPMSRIDAALGAIAA